MRRPRQEQEGMWKFDPVSDKKINHSDGRC